MSIGDRIKKARLKKGITQQQLGDMVGVQKSAIAKYESGRVSNIKTETMLRISEALSTSSYELVSGRNMAEEIAREFQFDDVDIHRDYIKLTAEQQLLIKYTIKEFTRVNKER